MFIYLACYFPFFLVPRKPVAVMEQISFAGLDASGETMQSRRPNGRSNRPLGGWLNQWMESVGSQLGKNIRIGFRDCTSFIVASSSDK